ncbi:MAG: hypothetical protein KGH66_04075 [Candidatus Micrarchaeota archaeon]|nr:hypothetical protein [Candidatus Micrarchaeota archaeon]
MGTAAIGEGTPGEGSRISRAYRQMMRNGSKCTVERTEKTPPCVGTAINGSFDRFDLPRTERLDGIMHKFHGKHQKQKSKSAN